jgi:Ala-tRNA(Pro) deacylase
MSRKRIFFGSLPGKPANAAFSRRAAVSEIARRGRSPLKQTGKKLSGRRITLMNEAQPKTADELFRFLDDLGIEHSTKKHEPVFTVAESVALRDEIPGGHTKNLFVKDKKDNYFLLTVEEHATVDLKTVHQVIGAASKVSFGKPEKLMEYLGVIPGAVTALGAINDTGGNVKVIIDEELMKFDVINCHPLSNDATTSIGSNDLLRFMEATGHEPLVLKVTA